MKRTKNKQIPFSFVLGTDKEGALTQLVAIKDAVTEAMFAVTDDELIFSRSSLTCLKAIYTEADIQYRELLSGPMRA
jgi:hypothetical protein